MLYYKYRRKEVYLLVYFGKVQKTTSDYYEVIFSSPFNISPFQSKNIVSLYELYTGEKFPVFAKATTKIKRHSIRTRIMTEEKIDSIQTKLIQNLSELLNYKKDRRIMTFDIVIKDIIMYIKEGFFMLNEVSYDEIDKSFMSGEGLSYDYYTYKPYVWYHTEALTEYRTMSHFLER